MLRTFGHSKKNVENKMKQTNEYSVDGRRIQEILIEI